MISMMTKTRGITARRTQFGVFLSLLLLTGLTTRSEEEPPTSEEKKGKTNVESKTTYGKPPPGLSPFSRYRKAYREFFLKPTIYRGPGREKEPAVLPQTVDLGLIGPLDPASREVHYGKSMLRGAELAIEAANAAGGYRGRPFRLIARNDSGAWGASSNVMARLAYEDKVWAVIGSVGGEATHVALRVALKAAVPMVNTASSDPTVTETRIPWILRCVADDRRQGYALAELIFRQRKLRRVAVLRTNSRYGRLGIREFADAARRLRQPILIEMRYEEGATSFETQLERIAALAPEALLLWGNAPEVARILKQVRKRGLNLQVFAADRVVYPELLKTAGAAAEGLTATYTFDPGRGNESFAAFREQFRARHSAEPDSFAAHAYDGTRILITAIRRAGLNRARILDALQDVRTFRGVTGEIVFDATLNDIGPVTIAEVKDGKWTFRPHASSPQPVVGRK